MHISMSLVYIRKWMKDEIYPGSYCSNYCASWHVMDALLCCKGHNNIWNCFSFKQRRGERDSDCLVRKGFWDFGCASMWPKCSPKLSEFLKKKKIKKGSSEFLLAPNFNWFDFSNALSDQCDTDNTAKMNVFVTFTNIITERFCCWWVFSLLLEKYTGFRRRKTRPGNPKH